MRVSRALLCLALVATACGSGRATETPDGAAIRWIDVDGKTNRFTGSFLSYFPTKVTVRPGDTVAFRSVWTGEPHSVTMGTLVDKAFGPGGKISSLPSWKLGTSDFLPPKVGRPCFLKKGAPPKGLRESCAVVEPRPKFDGKHTYYSSGFLPENRQFRVELSDDIKPGTYRFFCSFHAPKMAGSIRVAAEGAEIPPQDEVDAAAKERLAGFVERTLEVHGRTYEPYEDARVGRFPWPALASFETVAGRVQVLEFVPFTLKARVNERVRWSMFGAHTIAFDAPENAKPPAVRILNTGETELKADAVNESKSPQPPLVPAKRRVVLEAPTYVDGFLSSGMLYSPKRGRIEYVVRFADPGSYRYECLIHPQMGGLVTVSV